MVSLYLCSNWLTCQISSWVTMIYSCFHGPLQVSPTWQHHQVTLVQSIWDESLLYLWSLFWVPLSLVIVFYMSSCRILPIFIWPPTLLPPLCRTLVWVIDHPFHNQVNHYQVNHPYYALTREIVSSPPIFFPSIIIPGVSPSVTLLWFLMPWLRIPHCLNFGRPSSVDLNTFIPKEWYRGWRTLVLSFIFVWCLRSSKGNHHCPLTWLFLTCSAPAPYHAIEICTPNGSVIQKIVPLILECVWDVTNLMRGWPFR